MRNDVIEYRSATKPDIFDELLQYMHPRKSVELEVKLSVQVEIAFKAALADQGPHLREQCVERIDFLSRGNSSGAQGCSALEVAPDQDKLVELLRSYTRNESPAALPGCSAFENMFRNQAINRIPHGRETDPKLGRDVAKQDTLSGREGSSEQSVS
ncbi:MAG: hypothetical protein NVSMB26_10610 [Beijerinckiaceae bacterium]